METLALLLGGSWASGVNVYLTTAILGIAHRMDWIQLPGDLSAIAHPVVIVLAVLLYAIEFVADKVPFVDSAWDSVHTFIRPAGGAALGYLAMAGASPALQVPVAVLTGTISLDAHLTKATSRAAINTSPEPFSNSAASVAEDASVVGIMYLIMKHPIIATLCVILFIVVSIWFLRLMFRFIKRIFSGKNKTEDSETQERTARNKRLTAENP